MRGTKRVPIGLGVMVLGMLATGCGPFVGGARRSSCPAPPMYAAFPAPASPAESFTRVMNALHAAATHQQCVEAERRARATERRVAELEREVAELRAAARLADDAGGSPPGSATPAPAPAGTPRPAAAAALAPNPF